MTLREATVGSYYKVKKINGVGPLKRRIMDMGITKRSRNLHKKSGATWRPRTN